jgi:uncharacterized membrane protein
MWPWEHVVVGYIVFSLVSQLWRRESPRGGETLVVAFASLLPDLVDKPLSWSLGVVETGYGPAHSVFFALPLVALVVAVWATRDRLWRGIAFATGYLLHLPGDIVHNATGRGGFAPEIVLWPVRAYAGAAPNAGFLRESVLRVGVFRTQLLAGDLSLYAKVQLAVFALAVALWIADGTPVLRESIQRTRTLLGIKN